MIGLVYPNITINGGGDYETPNLIEVLEAGNSAPESYAGLGDLYSDNATFERVNATNLRVRSAANHSQTREFNLSSAGLFSTNGILHLDSSVTIPEVPSARQYVLASQLNGLINRTVLKISNLELTVVAPNQFWNMFPYYVAVNNPNHARSLYTGKVYHFQAILEMKIDDVPEPIDIKFVLDDFELEFNHSTFNKDQLLFVNTYFEILPAGLPNRYMLKRYTDSITPGAYDFTLSNEAQLGTGNLNIKIRKVQFTQLGKIIVRSMSIVEL